jgi:F420H(2)-dependent quinone reductase
MTSGLVNRLQKSVINPVDKLAFALRTPPPGDALLETTGRRTGQPRVTPAHRTPRLSAPAEIAKKCGWRRTPHTAQRTAGAPGLGSSRAAHRTTRVPPGPRVQ